MVAAAEARREPERGDHVRHPRRPRRRRRLARQARAHHRAFPQVKRRLDAHSLVSVSFRLCSCAPRPEGGGNSAAGSTVRVDWESLLLEMVAPIRLAVFSDFTDSL